MLSDMVRGGTCQRHSMMSGGTTARPVRAIHDDKDRELTTIPAAPMAETQTAVSVALTASDCM